MQCDNRHENRLLASPVNGTHTNFGRVIWWGFRSKLESTKRNGLQLRVNALFRTRNARSNHSCSPEFDIAEIRTILAQHIGLVRRETITSISTSAHPHINTYMDLWQNVKSNLKHECCCRRRFYCWMRVCVCVLWFLKHCFVVRIRYRQIVRVRASKMDWKMKTLFTRTGTD